MFSRAILKIAFAALLIGTSHGDDTHALPGSFLKTEDVVSTGDAIFVGEVLKIGPITLSASGGSAYRHNTLKVLKVLRGSVAVQISVGFGTDDELRESPPRVGSAYIFLVTAAQDPDPYFARKILAASDDNMAMISMLIGKQQKK